MDIDVAVAPALRNGRMYLNVLKMSVHMEAKGSYGNPKISSFVVAEPDGILGIDFECSEKDGLQVLEESLRKLLHVAEITVTSKLKELEEEGGGV